MFPMWYGGVMKTLDERFDAKWTEDENGCHVWQAGLAAKRYANFSIKGKSVRGHRWNYERYRGPIPEGMVLDHLCRNLRCVNPDHLEVVTQRENVARGKRGALKGTHSHCRNGHLYTEKNSWINPRNGNRYCRTCRADRSRESYQRKKTTG